MSTKLAAVSFPRLGAHRELKNLVEGYWLGRVSQETLMTGSRQLRETQWSMQREAGIDYISSNDFSFYDHMLDMACLLNVIPSRYRFLAEDELECYFAMARGVQNRKGDVTALDMKKWFNTNYHYIVPEIESDLDLNLNGIKPFAEYREAQACGINTKPVIIGPYTFLKLSKHKSRLSLVRLLEHFIPVYQEIISRFAALGLPTLQIDEPAIVMAMNPGEQSAFYHTYKKLLAVRGDTQILLQTYFGDIRDIYAKVMSLDFDAVGLDLVEGGKNLELIESYGFPSDKQLFAGLVNGKNIWINNYARTMDKIKHLLKYVNSEQVVLNTSCSLLHVPYSAEYEVKLGAEYRPYLSFAREKLNELGDLKELLEDSDYPHNDRFIANQALVNKLSNHPAKHRPEVRARLKSLTGADYVRHPCYKERIEAQKKGLGLPKLPTTTIGSFPQTAEVRQLRQQFRKGLIDEDEYKRQIKEHIGQVILLQEDLGFDVLVHGEYERNDRVEYFGENLEGFIFTENGWVQSYGTRGVKPPIIFGDVKRSRSITVEWIAYAQSLTDRPVKGMLTGPITILHWSYPREDLDQS